LDLYVKESGRGKTGIEDKVRPGKTRIKDEPGPQKTRI